MPKLRSCAGSTRRCFVRDPQDVVAVALAGAAHLGQPIDELAVEPDPDQAVGTWAGGRVCRP